MKRIISFLLALAVIVPIGFVMPDTVTYAAENTNGNATYNTGVNVVPAPGKVVIDGEFDEWDWSGRILMYKDYAFADIYQSEMATMWDSEALYLGFKFTDATPMVCVYDPAIEPGWTWRNDAIQLRTATDRARGWWTLSPYGQGEIGSLYCAYELEGETFGLMTKPGSSVLDQVTELKGMPKALQYDAEIKYKLWEKGGGYNVEVKLPWDMLYIAPDIKSGLQFTMGIENYWGDPTGVQNNEYSIFDNSQPGKTMSGFRGDTTWGYMTLLANGNIKQREYVHDKGGSSNGTIHIQAKVPKNAKKVTLRIEDKLGNVIANAVNELDVDENSIIGEDGNNYIIDTTWDGTDLYGNMVSPGKYTVTGIYHEGIIPYFEGTTYNPGTPPWPSSTGAGSWGSDHYPSESITSIGDNIFIGASMAESGSGVIKVDNNGKKIWGGRRGAEYLAANDKYIYALPGTDFYADTSQNGNHYVLRIDAQTGRFAPFVLDGKLRDLQLYMDEILGIKGGVMPSVTGMAATNEYLVMATMSNHSTIGNGYANYGEVINVLDADSGVLVKKIAAGGDIGSIYFGKNGLLYAEIGGTIKEVNIKTGAIRALPISQDKDDMFGVIAVDNDGNIIVYERNDRQLRVYTVGGKLLYTIGKKGGRALMGKWDPNGLTHQVSALTVDSLNQIWVVEYWNYPRRISVWNKDGFVKDFIGGPGYMGAGGALHETDPDKAYNGATEMKVNYDDGSYEVTNIQWVPDIVKHQAFPMDARGNTVFQHFRSDAGGVEREFIFNGTDTNTVMYQGMEDGTFQPFWACFKVTELWKNPGRFADRTGKGYDINVYSSDFNLTARQAFAEFTSLDTDTQILWNDWDNDACIDSDEWEIIEKGLFRHNWGSRVTDKLEFTLTNWRNTYNVANKVSPAFFTEDGLPRYTKASWSPIVTQQPLFIGENVLLSDGKLISIRAGSLSKTNTGYANGIKAVDTTTGEDLWWYDNHWPGVQGSQLSSVQKPGEVLGPIKLLGTIDSGDNTQTIFIRGNMGNDFLLTTDGYYVQTLFRDGRIPMLRLPDNYEDAKGLDMSKFSENGEPFSGTIVKHSDGKVRLLSSSAGPTMLVVRVEGLDTIKHIEPFEITLTQKQIDEAEFANDKPAEEEDTGNKEDAKNSEITISKAKGEIKIDGNIVEWTGAKDIEISQTGVEEQAYAMLSYDDENLYAAFTVNDKTPMANGGQEAELLFKTGDVCDIQLRVGSGNGGSVQDGDFRLLLSSFNDEPTAVIMREISSVDKKPYRYNSPVMELTFDYVKVLSEAEVAISRDSGNGVYYLEARIPLASLGLKLESGSTLIGDIGLIASDETGTINKSRTYFYNKNTGLVSDQPSEARLMPSSWGKVNVE